MPPTPLFTIFLLFIAAGPKFLPENKAKTLMVCSKFAYLLLLLLLSLLPPWQHAMITRVSQDTMSLEDFEKKFSATSTVSKMKISIEKDIRISMGEGKEEKNTIQSTVNKPSVAKCWQEKSKSSKCKRSLLTGEASTPSNKQIRQSNKNVKDINFYAKMMGNGFVKVEISRRTEINSPLSKFPSLGSEHLHKIETQSKRFKEETTSVYAMMIKDYHLKAKRKPPINNHQPSEGEEDVKP